jgi:hypothetical protein
MDIGPSRIPYGEWPARHAVVGEVELTWAMLAAKGVNGDQVVLIGSCAPAEYDGSYECSADAAGFQWSFRGSVIDQQPDASGQVRLRVRSDGELTIRQIHQ